ncbi:MAG: hypothetical protein IT209_00740 [Armatimonadetes bacterium]|nr:hypothetical protein [Armatimonadota bacterium]
MAGIVVEVNPATVRIVSREGHYTERISALSEAALDRVAARVLAEITSSMQEEKHGRPGPFRTRSAPGEAPAVQTGNLIESMEAWAPRTGVRRIGSKRHVEYALYLEFGTQRMAPRPFLRPAAEVAKRFLREELKKQHSTLGR